MRPPHDNTLSQPSRPLAITLADIVERFKSAWRQAPPAPDLAAFLPPEGELRRRGLEDLVLIDLEHRLKAGQAARVEDYLRRYHELADGGAALSELIAAEHRLRLGREPGLDAAEYLARFPQCREAILARLGPTAQPPGTQRTALPADSRTLDLPQTDTVDTAPAALPLPARRYLLGEEIGHGGMGEVHRARDPHLGRELAVKVLRGDRHTNPESLRRFVEEAQVCGQLQHPAIVPVHDLGRLEDERPFFAMKLVKGRTLADLLKDRAGPADGLPRFLTIFEQICQALAYAHARGVIHRDLKPANVMVGAFGEVQVMDWGLAKVLRPQASAPTVVETAATIIRTVRSAGLDESRDGQAVGTPAYMAPEQARGEVELLDERCDVFGLGAILCEVLTGKPPFIGSTPNEIHARAMCADLGGAFARLDGCGADAELVGLAKACLAADAAARPRDAGAVTATVTAYQHAVQERLREAELGRARAQVRAVEERKRRRLTVGLALAMLTLVVSLAAVGLWLQRQRAERREEAARQQAERQAEAARQEGALRQDMEARLAQAASLRRGGHFEEGLKLLGQARQRLGADGPDDLREQVDRASSDTALARRLDEARQRASTLTEERRLDYAGAAKEYGAALRGAGLGREGEDAAAVAARVRASAVRVEIVAALDEWVGLTSGRARREWLLAVARLADPDPLRDRLRQPERWRDKTALARLAKEASAQELPPQLAAALARALLRSGGDAVPLLRATQARYPDDFWLNFLLGGALLGGKERDEAIGFYRAALALRPRAAVIHNNLGVALGRTGKQDEAIRHYERAVALAPNNALAHNNLGIVLRSKGKLEEAIRHFEEALRIDPKFADAHVTLGSALRARKPEEAIRHFEEALRIDPKNANAHVNLGLALYGKGKQEEAIRHYERALQSDPKNANAHHYLGNALYDQGKQEEAIRHFEEALRIDP
ncbi:MAG TPA: serine/threonine-protein kinase, partial [Gemmataceae bacterium]|nr:serine/threonine-protein kinase [Gemmataceae bacterium]